MRLDSFHYFTPDHPLEHLRPILTRNRFDGSIAVSRVSEDPREFLAQISRHDFVKAAVVAADPDDPHLGLLLDECAQVPKFRGLFWQATDSFPRSLAELDRRGLPLDLQITPERLSLAVKIASRFPNLPIAVVHLGSPDIDAAFDDWARGIEALAQFPQVDVKASDLIHLAPRNWKNANLRPHMQHVLACFSPARVMFGSGWPSGLPAHIWKESLAAFTQAIGAQSMETREQLLGESARRFYRLL